MAMSIGDMEMKMVIKILFCVCHNYSQRHHQQQHHNIYYYYKRK